MEEKLPNGFEWCRKAKYNVQAELGCYEVTSEKPLIEGFEEKVIDGKEYAVKSGFNVLEQNNWTTSPQKPYILTGTVGERWPVKPSNMSAYDVDPVTIGVNAVTISTKDPSDQEFLVAMNVPEEVKGIKVVPSWAFGDDGSIDETQLMVANSESSMVSHDGGDYVVAKHISGQPEYMELPESKRNTREMAELYDPRVINGSVMQTTYDHAKTKQEITDKYFYVPDELKNDKEVVMAAINNSGSRR